MGSRFSQVPVPTTTSGLFDETECYIHSAVNTLARPVVAASESPCAALAPTPVQESMGEDNQDEDEDEDEEDEAEAELAETSVSHYR